MNTINESSGIWRRAALPISAKLLDAKESLSSRLESRGLAEEEKVFRVVLRELRERAESVDVRDDVEKLEKLLNDPLFKQYSRKSSGGAPRVVKREGAIGESALVKFLRDNVEEELLRNLKDNQVINFICFNTLFS
ncbi:hypothetical protein OSTOST_19277 [Ostertagia ostertagi]